jgi:hypothetical protein
MATINPNAERFRAGSWGNAGVKTLRFTVAAGNAAQDGTNDVLVIPAGTRIIDWHWVLKTKSSVANGTVDAGFVAVDGGGYLDLANSVADDPDFLADALVVGSGGTNGTTSRKGSGATVPANGPLLLERDAYLRLTNNTAAVTDLVLDLVLNYEFVGNK